MDTHDRELRISAMTAENVEGVGEIERQCFSRPWSVDSLARELLNPLAVYRTALLCGKTVGYSGMHHVIDEGYITNIAVLPAYRGRRIAKALLDDMIEYAYENKLRILTLEVRESNAAAQALYAGYGFEKAGMRRNFYEAAAEDGIIMTKELYPTRRRT